MKTCVLAACWRYFYLQKWAATKIWMNLEEFSNFMVIDPDFFLHGDALVTEKILDFPGNFRKFDGLLAEIKKKPLLEI